MWQHNELARINLLEGSVSSGKTWVSLVLWAFWVATMPKDKLYLMCAKSLTTLKRNCLILLQELVGESNFQFSVPSKEGYLFGRRVLFEGANDARSESKIRGLSLQGAYCDELTQFPEDFFTMLLSRLRLPGAKLIATTNPDSPNHWLMTEYIERADELDFLDLKFTIDDNTTLDPEYVKAIKTEYVGVFYERFILGEWKIASGLVYGDSFSEKNIVDEVPKSGEYYISIDYGTSNPTAAGLWCVTDTEAVMIKEYYYDGREERKQKSDESYYKDIEKFAQGYNIEKIIVDPSAASLKTTIRDHGKFTTMNANNDVINGIRKTASFLEQGKIKFHRSCKNTFREFELYSWDDRAQEDAVIKESDHSMDQVRYIVYTILRHKFRDSGFKPILPL